MLHERPTTNANERYHGLRSMIFASETRDLRPEHAAMFSAENDANFVHFIDSLSPEMHEQIMRAEGGDTDAAQAIALAYQEFRDLFESGLAERDPEVYNAFIDAVARGDADTASMIVDEFYRQSELVDQPVIDDELDAQFT